MLRETLARILGGRSEALAFFFSQLARILEAIGSVARALSLAADQIASPSLRGAVVELHRMVAAGLGLGEAMRLHGPPFEAPWVRLVEAGEASGELSHALERVAARIERSARRARRARASLVYPAFLLHGAMALWPLRHLITGGIAPYLSRVLATLALAYGALLVLALAARRLAARGARRGWDPRSLPLVGPVLADLRASDLCWSIGALHESGTHLRQAVRDALRDAPAGEDPSLGRAVDALREGGSFQGFVRESGLFPKDTAGILETAEQTGDLGAALLAEAGRLEERASHGLDRLARGAARAFYLLAVGVAAWVILAFWRGYFSELAGLASW